MRSSHERPGSKWFSNILWTRKSGSRTVFPPRARPLIELMEERLLLATTQPDAVLNLSGAAEQLNAATTNSTPPDTDSTYLGTNPVTITSGDTASGIKLENHVYQTSAASGNPNNNNPAYLTSFIGNETQVTGEGTPGSMTTLYLGSAAGSITFTFTNPIGPSSYILVSDVDLLETVKIQAYDQNGDPISLANWTAFNFTGENNSYTNDGKLVQDVTPPPVTSPPDSTTWANWDLSTSSAAASEGITDDIGKLVSPTSDDLSNPLNVLQPSAQNVYKLVFTAHTTGTTDAVEYQIISPGATLSAVSGSGPYGGTATLTAILLNSDGTPIVDEPVTFSLTNGTTATSIGTVDTGNDGIATLSGASLAGFSAGEYPTGVTATYDGDATDSTSTQTEGNLNVQQVAPVLTWAKPAGITYGTKLGSTQLDATASVPGTFVYSPSAGTVLGAGLGQTLMATFTPDDTTDFTTKMATTTIDVAQAMPVITWPAPADIELGTALSSAQLNASTPVAGKFVYSPAAGTVLGAGPDQPLSAVFTPTDTVDYTTATATVNISVLESSPNAVINMVNSDGEEADEYLDDDYPEQGKVFKTSFLGVNDVTIEQTLSSPSDDYSLATAVVFGTASATNNNPSYLSSFVGSPLPPVGEQGTGNGTVEGSMYSLLAGNGDAFEIKFTIAIGPASQILLGDIDGDETVTVSATDSGKAVALAEAAYTGMTPGLPDPPGTNSWPTWDPTTGTLTSTGNTNLDEDMIVLTPTATVNELTFSETGAGGVNYQVISPGSSLSSVSGAGTYAGTGNLTATLLNADGAPIVNAPVTFSLVNGSTVTSVGTTDTGNNGVATFNGANVAGFPVSGSTTYVEATFAGDATDSPTTAFGNLALQQATPSITWTDPADITFGTPLGRAQLDASASVPGSFTYSPPAGTLLGAGPDQTLEVTFTPTDTTDYTTATKTAMINVLRAEPMVTWASPAAITYGTPLGPAQLDATSPVDGTFAYTPEAGTILGAGQGQTLSVTFTPTDTTDYTDTPLTTTIDVLRAMPAIDWPDPADITYGTPLGPTQLNASLSVAGTFAYSPDAGTILGVGQGQILSLTFTPTDSTDYTTATATATINVDQAMPSITWANPADITFGTLLGPTQLDASASVAGSYTYSPPIGTLLESGQDQVLSVSFTPTDTTDYTTATATATINVLPPNPKMMPVLNWANPAPIVYGTPLSTTQLDATATYKGIAVSGTFNYGSPANTMLNAGMNQSLPVSFTPTDATDFTTATATAFITVSPAPLTITAKPETKVYGTADPALAYSASGFQSSDTAGSVLTGALARAEAGTLAGEQAGGYAISLGTLAADSNYTISFTGSTLTITPAALSVTANPETKVYGTADPALTDTPAGLVDQTADGVTIDDTAASVLIGSPSRAKFGTLAGEQVGDYAINQGTLAADNDYTMTFTGATLTITPATLAVTANPQTKVYGTADPTLTDTPAGLVDQTVDGVTIDDTAASVLNGSLSRALSGTLPGEQVGDYAISQGTLAADSNYTISFTGSTLTITQAALSVAAKPETKVFGTADPALTDIVAGVVDSTVDGVAIDDTAATALSGHLARAAGDTVAGGPYAIRQGTLAADSNYTISFTGSTLTITPATPLVTESAPGGTYTGAPIAATATVTGVSGTATPDLEGVTPTLTYYAGPGTSGTDLGSKAPSAAGTYTVVARFAGSADYAAAQSKPAIFAIAPARATIALGSSSASPVYGQAVTFVATVNSASGTPVGTVTFADGTTLLATVPLDGSGQAALTITTLNPGSHAITATYNGGTGFLGGKSGTAAELVSQSPTAIILVPHAVLKGKKKLTAVSLTAEIEPVAPGGGVPTGQVTFEFVKKHGKKVTVKTLGTAELSGGEATLTLKPNQVLNKPLKIVYSGDPDFLASTTSPPKLTKSGIARSGT